MKKIIALLLILSALLLASCSGTTPAVTQTGEEPPVQTETNVRSVPAPLQTPDYSFDHEPTVDEMRAMAVRAMRDIVTVQWYPEKTVRYNKEGAVSQKNFEFFKERFYMGFPYTSAGMGIFQFLEYYDGKTGCLHYTDQSSFNETIGTSCAGATCWGLLSVCNSIRGNCVSNYLTIPNGFYPLGEVTYDPAVDDFNNLFTTQIIRDNGDAKVLEGYAALKPGDLVVFSEGGQEGGHTRMAIAEASVVRAGGAIDPEKSSVLMQEQAAHDTPDESTGVTMTRSGEYSKEYSFAELLKDGYIAVTTAEFLGEKPYEKCAVTFEGAADTLKDVFAGKLISNYPMATVKVVLHTGDGDTALRTVLLNRNNIGDGSAFAYDLTNLSNLATDRRVPRSGAFSVSLEVTTSTGEHFTPVTFTAN